MDKCTIVIPSYNPNVSLTMLIDELLLAGFKDIVIVDDGSNLDDKKVQMAYAYIRDKSECTLIHHGANMGKGAALKTGFKHCLLNRPKDTLVITVDDDGQYGAECVKQCLEQYESMYDDVYREHGEPPVLLGARKFADSGYKIVKRAVNYLCGFIMKYMCFVNVRDVQTGLRLIPHRYLRDLLKVDGHGFDYDINMLPAMKYRNIPYIEVSIQIEQVNGKYADYNPVGDVLRCLGVMIRYVFSSLSATALDVVVFYLLLMMFDSGVLPLDKSFGMLYATIIARVISATYNCIVNKKAVFKSDTPMKTIIIRFYIFSLIKAVMSYVMLLGSSYLLGMYADSMTVIIKLVIDLILFFGGYGIQKKWIF